MNAQQILADAIRWMRRRKWREKIAKSASGQSLYEHSLIELDVFLTLAPILRDPKHYGLTQLEEMILIVSLIVHDAGKETDEWQTYVTATGPRESVSHILPDLSAELVPQICADLGFEDISVQVHRVIVNCAGIHHNRPGQSAPAIFETLLSGTVDRFLTLAHLVKSIDHLCSAESPGDAVICAEKDHTLSKHLELTAHEVVYRGISTSLLHKAAQGTFEAVGWQPLLYFVSGTVYAADLNVVKPAPTGEEIRLRLRIDLESALARDIAPLMVGIPTRNILPKPELISFSETRLYLVTAGQKIGPLSFAKKQLADRRKVVQQYLKLKGDSGVPSDAEVERHSGRISVAQPEMIIFKFFKAIMDPDKIPVLGQDGAALARGKYESVFGLGSWDQLQTTSTLMAARDMASTVDRYWELPGSRFGHGANTVEQIPDEIRMQLLVDTLAGIAAATFAAIQRPSPRDALAESMANSFTSDLLIPTIEVKAKDLAARQLNHYRLSKASAGKELAAASHFCPICSIPFGPETAKKALKDFIENPTTHTNRGVSHGKFDQVIVCSACYHERVLRQLLMGQPIAQMIALSPRMNLGALNGKQLTQRISEWADAAGSLQNAEFGFSLNFTDEAARQMADRDPLELKPEEAVALFRYRNSSQTRKERRNKALELLTENFDGDLDALNASLEEPFPNWDRAVDALLANEIDQQECKSIRRQIPGLDDAIHLIPQTPNLLLIPLRYEIAASKDESEANKALRTLYVALILSSVFDSAVSIRSTADISDSEERTGAAFVPPVPALRAIVRREWVPVSEARHWIDAIGAASVLSRDADFPPRSAIYQALTADPAEKLVRRIEEQEKGRTVSLRQLNLISLLPFFHSATSNEVHH
jgi:hypothetical protein